MLSVMLFSSSMMILIWGVLQMSLSCPVCGCDPCDCHPRELRQ